MAITVPIVSTWDAKGVDKAMRDIQRAEGGWAKGAAGIKAATAPAAAALGVLSVAGFGAVKSAEEAERANKGLAQVFKSMGYEENTDAAIKYADALERTTGITAEEIKAAQTKLATFSEVAKSTETMGRATEIAADLSAAGFGSMGSASVMLGKAIQDPVKGITALSRVGVTFTEDQKAMIEEMVKAGDAAGAQGLIMEALETQVGGVAEETASSTAKMANAWGEVVDEVGDALMPAFEDLTAWMLKAAGIFRQHSGLIVGIGVAVASLSATILVLNAAMKAWRAITMAVSVVQAILHSRLVMAAILTARATLSIVAQNLALARNKAALLASRAAMVLVRTATLVWTATQWALNAALTANPIGLVIAAIALLVGAIVLAYKKSDTFRDIVNGLWRVLKGSVVTAFRAVSSAISSMVGWLQTAWAWVQKLLDKLSLVRPPSFSLGGIFGRSAPSSASGASVSTSRAATTSALPSGNARTTITVNGSANPQQVARELSRLMTGATVRTGYRGVRA